MWVPKCVGAEFSLKTAYSGPVTGWFRNFRIQRQVRERVKGVC